MMTLGEEKMLRNLISGVLILLVIFCFIGCTDDDDDNNIPTGPQLTDTQEALVELLDTLPAKYGVPGISFGMINDDGSTWAYATGYSHLNPLTEMVPEDLLKLGSVSKTFTATVLLQLIDEGEFDLMDDVRPLLPDSIAALIPPCTTDSVLTIKRLLSHRTGILNYVHSYDFAMSYVMNPHQTFTDSQLLGFVGDTLQFEPGVAYEYSNSNYIILSTLAEHVTGSTFGDLLQTRVFDPLNLDNTYYPLADTELPEGIVDGYYDFGGDGVLSESDLITYNSPSAAAAAGAIVSSIPDLLLYLPILVNGDLISAELLTARKTDYSEFDYEGVHYGYGLGLAHQDDMAWGHQGGIDGYNSIINMLDNGMGFVVIVNGQSPVPEWSHTNVANDVYQDVLAELNLAPAAVKGPSIQEDPAGDYSRGLTMLGFTK
jgi:D-alanyl-D-alanine carboxypeptidase